MRGQAFHAECKAVWAKRKRAIFKANQILFHIRTRGYYWLDGQKQPVTGLSDEAILFAIGLSLPSDLVYEKMNRGGFRFKRVVFRPGLDRYPWKIPRILPSVLDKKRRYEMGESYALQIWS
jgi:hypothetical protein